MLIMMMVMAITIPLTVISIDLHFCRKVIIVINTYVPHLKWSWQGRGICLGPVTVCMASKVVPISV